MNLGADTIQSLNKKLGLVYTLLGLAFLAGAVAWVHHNHLDVFLLHPTTAQGTVIENKKELVAVPRSGNRAAHSYTAYRALVRFVDANGKNIIAIDQIAFSQPSFSVGQTVKVLYNAKHPEHAMIDRGRKNLIIPAIIGFFGFFMVLGGVQRLMKKPT